MFGRLIYGGPGVYLCQTNEGLIDLRTDSLVSANETKAINQIARNMAEMHERLSANPSVGLLGLLLPDEDLASASDVIPAIEEFADRQVRSFSYHYVPYPGFFSSQNNTYCGVWPTDGSLPICGYIAANLMYRYWNYRGQVALYSSYTSQTGVQNGTYTHFLYNWGTTYLGLSDLTCAWDIAGLMNNICSYYNMTQAASWALFNTGAWAEISTNNRPVILFGAPTGYGNHAFVAYGVKVDAVAGQYFWISHMGKNNGHSAIDVNMSDLIGSNMKCSY